MSMYHQHERVQIDASKDGRTKQSFAEESNINLIMKKYEKTGMLDHLNQHNGEYGDFIAAPDYHSAMNAIRIAGETFMSIPATVRAKFDNDPARFLAFVQDPENTEKMIEMGLARPPAKEATTPKAKTEVKPSEKPKEASTSSKNAPE